MELDIWSTSAIVLGFSLLLVAADEYIAKPWRHRLWDKRAKSGDREAQELLKLARSAKVVDE